MKVITTGRMVLFVTRLRSIRGEVDVFSNLIKRIIEIADTTRRTKNIPKLAEVETDLELSPISRYVKAISRNVMPEANANAPFISILFFGRNEEEFSSFSLLLLASAVSVSEDGESIILDPNACFFCSSTFKTFTTT